MKRKPRLIQAPHAQGQGPVKAPIPLNVVTRGPAATTAFPHFSQSKRPTSASANPHLRQVVLQEIVSARTSMTATVAIL